MLLSVVGFSLTGCVVAPYDDRPNYSGNHHSYDRPYWNNGNSNRPDYRPNYRPNDRPQHQKPKPHQNRPHYQENRPSMYRAQEHRVGRSNEQRNKPTEIRSKWNSPQFKQRGLSHTERPSR